MPKFDKNAIKTDIIEFENLILKPKGLSMDCHLIDLERWLKIPRKIDKKI